MKLFNFLKLGLAILLATTFFTSCEAAKELTSPYRDGYISGDGNEFADYTGSNLDNFYHSPSKGEVELIRGFNGDTVTYYEYISMNKGKYTDDVEFIQITLNPNTADTTYSAEFTPNPKWNAVATIVDNVITITYPDGGLEKDEFVGMLKLSFTKTDGTTETTEKDYFDVYNSDDINAIFN